MKSGCVLSRSLSYGPLKRAGGKQGATQWEALGPVQGVLGLSPNTSHSMGQRFGADSTISSAGGFSVSHSQTLSQQSRAGPRTARSFRVRTPGEKGLGVPASGVALTCPASCTSCTCPSMGPLGGYPDQGVFGLCFFFLPYNVGMEPRPYECQEPAPLLSRSTAQL